MMTKKLFILLLLIFIPLLGQAQESEESPNTQQLISQFTEVYTSGEGVNDELIGQLTTSHHSIDNKPSALETGFSAWGIMANIIFSGIGFVAFIYGKKNNIVRPMLIGIALMGYTYFLHSVLLLYVVGIGLTACLYFFRE